MRFSFWQHTDHQGRKIFPFVLTLFLVIFGLVPSHIPWFAPVSPSFLLISVFYWALHRPDLMPPWVSFLLAIISDFLTGTPAGISAVMILMFQRVVESQRRFLLTGSFWVLWLAFCLLASLAIVVEWSLVWLVTTGLLDYSSAVFRLLITAALYPFTTWIFVLVQRKILKI